jgi:superfamily I DNA/RNA helicase
MSSTKAMILALQHFEEAKISYLANETDSTQAILDAARAILSAGGQDQDKQPASSVSRDEKPSDFLQRVMWAEVSDNTNRRRHINCFKYRRQHIPICIPLAS